MNYRLLFVWLILLAVQPVGRAQGFVRNKGQMIDQNGNTVNDLLFTARKGNLQIQLRKNGYSYEYFSCNEKIPDVKKSDEVFTQKTIQQTISRIDVDFVNANTAVEIKTNSSKQGINYFVNGNNITTELVTQVLYRAIYPGIDIEFLYNETGTSFFKYNIIVHQGADISKLKFLVQGATLSLTDKALQLQHRSFTVDEKIPLCYTLDDNTLLPNFEFVVTGNYFSFAGQTLIKKTCVIDPISNLMWGTYQGDNGTDVTMAMGKDDQNNVYVTGYTSSAANIASTGAFQVNLAGSLDIFLAKFTSQGQRVWTTYFGSTAVDLAYVLYVKPDGNSYIAGATNSTVNLATSGAHQTIYGGGINDIVVAAFDANGQRLWASYYGGTAHDIAQGITCDKLGSVLFTGHTESTNNIATAGALKTIYNFNYDVCLVKFTPNGQRVWGTYYGDSGVDEAYAICTDNQSNIYITGLTSSITDIATAGAHQQFNAGAADAFIAKIDSAGKNLLFGTFYGGTLNDAGTAIECDNSKLYVGGNTSSTNNIASTGAWQTAPGSADDAFLGAFTLSGARIWCSYLGGEDTDYLNDIVLDVKSQLLICGATASSLNISTSGAWQTTLASPGNYDAYLMRFTSTGIKQLATYYGGEGNDQARGMAIDKLGHVYLAGESTSTAGIVGGAAFQTNNGGNTDAFLAKFCIPFSPKISPTKSISICPGSLTISAVQGYANYIWSNSANTSSIVVTHTAIGSYTYALQVNDGVDCNGSSDTTLVKVVTCVDIVKNNAATSLVVFPNPAHNWLSIRTENVNLGFTSLKIMDANGKLVKQENYAADVMISELANGLYCLLLEAEGQVYTYKFIKE